MAARRFGLILLIFLCFGALLIFGKMLFINMPGESYEGVLPALNRTQSTLRDRLRDHVHRLAGVIGERNLHHYEALNNAAQYITETLRSCGYAVSAQTFTVQGKAVSNLEAVTEGTHQVDEIVVIGAHYDSVYGSPGANDNGSGVAALLELARMVRLRNLSRTVRFVAFVNEEPPFFRTDAMGSRRYAQRAASLGEPIVAMLSLETIGYYSERDNSQFYPFPFGYFYPKKGNFIGFVGNLRSRRLVRRAIASFRAHARFPSEGVAAPGWLIGIGWSDHLSFWEAGYPAIMVTDTALFRYRQYHSMHDLPEIIDYDGFARVVGGLEGVVVDLANSE